MKLATKEFGKGNAKGQVIMLHGTGAAAEMWAPQIKILEESGWHCIVPDLRGHGETHEPGEPTNLEVHINDLCETLEAHNVKFPAIFVGHSLGSIISLAIAEKHPQMVSKVLAVSLPVRVPQITSAVFKVILSLPYKSLRGTAIHRNLAWRERTLLQTHDHSLKQIVEHFADLDYLENIPKTQCPVHFAIGRLDPVAPCMYLEELQKKVPNSTLKIIEWAGHNCMDSQPNEFNRWFVQRMEE